MNTNEQTNTQEQSSPVEQENTNSDRTYIYTALNRLREAFKHVTNSDSATMEYFEQNARIIVAGVAHIADGRDLVISELIKSQEPKETDVITMEEEVDGTDTPERVDTDK